MVNNLSNVGNTRGIMRKLQRIIIQKNLYQFKIFLLLNNLHFNYDTHEKHSIFKARSLVFFSRLTFCVRFSSKVNCCFLSSPSVTFTVEWLRNGKLFWSGEQRSKVIGCYLFPWGKFGIWHSAMWN